MIPETIGAVSWPKRLRQFLADLFGSSLVAHLRQELIQAKLERDRVIADLRAENRELLNKLLASKGIAPIIQSPQVQTKTTLGPTRWQQIQAEAIQENARLEAEEAKKEN